MRLVSPYTSPDLRIRRYNKAYLWRMSTTYVRVKLTTRLVNGKSHADPSAGLLS